MRESLMRQIWLQIPRWQKISVFICMILVFYWELVMYFVADELLHPQRPELHIDTATLTQLDVMSSAGVGPPELTASLEVTILVTNPDALRTLDFHSIEALLFYKMVDDETMNADGRTKLLLAAKPVTPSFFMYTRRNSTLSFRIKTSDGTFVDEYRVAEPISEAKARGGSVFLEIKMLAWWGYRKKRSILFPDLGGNSRWLAHEVTCSQLEFAFDDTVTQTWILTVDSSRECEHPNLNYNMY